VIPTRGNPEKLGEVLSLVWPLGRGEGPRKKQKKEKKQKKGGGEKKKKKAGGKKKKKSKQLAKKCTPEKGQKKQRHDSWFPFYQTRGNGKRKQRLQAPGKPPLITPRKKGNGNKFN